MMLRTILSKDFIVDFTALLFFLLLIINATTVAIFVCVCAIYSVFVLLRLLIPVWPGIIRCLIYGGLLLSCCIELFLGFIQLFGIKESNHLLYAVTGSFNNPGPYAGWLAVCNSIFIAYLFKCDNWQRSSFLKKWIVTPLAVITVIFIPATQSRSALMAVLISIFVLLFSISRFRKLIKKYLLLILAVFCIGSIVAYTCKSRSADGRFFMNKISLRVMCRNNGKGVGLGNFAGAFGQEQASYFHEQMNNHGRFLDWNNIKKNERLVASSPQNAFNEFLQIGVEGGLVPLLLFLTLIIIALIHSYRKGSVWCYGLIAFSVYSLFSSSLSVVAFQLFFPAILALCLTDEKRLTKGDWVLNSLVLMGLLTIVSLKTPEYIKNQQANNIYKKSRPWYQLGFYEDFIDDVSPLWNHLNKDAEYLYDLGYSLHEVGNYEKSDSVLELGYSISSSPSFFLTMGDNSMKRKKYQEAEDYYLKSFYMVPSRITPLNKLSLLYHEKGDTVMFLQMAEIIKTFIPKVESEKVKHLRMEILELEGDYNLKERDDYDN